jgi:hypothetical protein
MARVKVTAMDGTREVEYGGIMRFAVVTKSPYGNRVIALFTNYEGAEDYREKWRKGDHVLPLIRDVGDGVKGHKVERDDNADLMAKLKR